MVTVTEKHVCYAATVPTVPQAFEFVMAHLDEFAEPRIEIRPKRLRPPLRGGADGEGSLNFEVTVGGLVNA